MSDSGDIVESNGLANMKSYGVPAVLVLFLVFMWHDIGNLKDTYASFPEKYVLKDDFNKQLDEVKEMLREIRDIQRIILSNRNNNINDS